MTDGGMGAALKQLQDLYQVGAVGRLTDGELLERFAGGRGAAADRVFAALVERHGPMVLRVCRDLLGDAHEAEDAFQATFLVLARRSGSIRRPETLANWLYGVAHRTARKARAQARRRRSREAREAGASAIEAPEHGWGHDVATEHREQAGLVHEELGRLPDKQRAAIVLCCLEGLTVEEAARRLDCTAGAVRGRLAQGRSRLKARLARRGIVVTPAALAISTRTASASLTSALRDATTRAGMSLFRDSASGVAASRSVVELAEGTSRLMLLFEPRLRAASLAALVAVGVGAWVSSPLRRDAGEPRATVTPGTGPGPELHRRLVEAAEWYLTAADPARRTITISDLERGGQPITLVRSPGGLGPSGLTIAGLEVAPDARIRIDESAADLTRLRPGLRLTVTLAPDRFVATGIHAKSPNPPPTICTLEGVDLARRTIDVSVGASGMKLENLRLADGAEISLMGTDGDGGAHLETIGLDDLRPGMPVALSLETGADGRLTVRSVMSGRGEPNPETSR